MLDRIRGLRPDVQGLQTDVELPASMMGTARGKGPPNQDSATRDAARANAQSQYEGAARGFAQSLEVLAAELRRLPGPKLLVTFTQGLDPQIYFEGASIALQTGSAAIHLTAASSALWRPISASPSRPSPTRER